MVFYSVCNDAPSLLCCAEMPPENGSSKMACPGIWETVLQGLRTCFSVDITQSPVLKRRFGLDGRSLRADGIPTTVVDQKQLQ